MVPPGLAPFWIKTRFINGIGLFPCLVYDCVCDCMNKKIVMVYLKGGFGFDTKLVLSHHHLAGTEQKPPWKADSGDVTTVCIPSCSSCI